MTRLISTMIVLTAVMLTGLAQAAAQSKATRPGSLPATVSLAAGPAAAAARAPDAQVTAGGWAWRAGGDLRDIQFFDADNGWIVGNVGPLHTTDGGATWTALSGFSAYELNDLQFTDAQNGWAVGSNGTILHTGDGGATWTPQAGGNDGKSHPGFLRGQPVGLGPRGGQHPAAHDRWRPDMGAGIPNPGAIGRS